MKRIMVVEDSFSTKNAGVIISGVNPEFDFLDSAEIKRLIGTKIKVVIAEGFELDVDVKEIAISESLVGKKNISIAMGAMEGIDHVKRGSWVYAIE